MNVGGYLRVSTIDEALSAAADGAMVISGGTDVMETHGCVASFDADGKLTVWSSSQDVFGMRRSLAKVFGLPYSKVRVIAPALGGGFGGKIDLTCEPVAALLSYKCGQPVRLVLNRQEDIAGGPTRHAEKIHVRMSDVPRP